jgi:hypothetical protein
VRCGAPSNWPPQTSSGASVSHLGGADKITELPGSESIEESPPPLPRPSQPSLGPGLVQGAPEFSLAPGSKFIGTWNWGAFLLAPFWLMNHGRPWRGVLALVPYVNIPIAIAYGIVGNRVAVKCGRFSDETQFVAVQNAWRNWGFWVAGAFVALLCVSAIGSRSDLTSYENRARTGSESVTPGGDIHPVTVLSLSGSGTKSTEAFPVTGDWDLKWSYDCSNWGASGNFIVAIKEAGGMPSGDNDIEQLSAGGDSIEHYHNGTGKRYLEITSECRWSLEVTDYE